MYQQSERYEVTTPLKIHCMNKLCQPKHSTVELLWKTFYSVIATTTVVYIIISFNSGSCNDSSMYFHVG